MFFNIPSTGIRESPIWCHFGVPISNFDILFKKYSPMLLFMLNSANFILGTKFNIKCSTMPKIWRFDIDQ